MSTNYARGRRYEYRVIAMLEKVGYTADRTAGSHGLYDVIAFNAHHVRLIQVKSGSASMAPAEREAFRLMPCPGNVQKEVWMFEKRGKPPILVALEKPSS